MKKNQPAQPTAGDPAVQENVTDKPAEATKVEAPVPERKVTPMDEARFKGAEYAREIWVATAHENTTPKDLLEPAYWAHIATKLRPRARIEAWANDGTWMAEYVVLEAGRNWAKLHLLSVHHLGTADVALTRVDAMSPYEISFGGPHVQWRVIRKVDREVIHDGEATMDGAVSWLKERLKAGV
jgi:hypothetical protein